MVGFIQASLGFAGWGCRFSDFEVQGAESLTD